MKVTHSKETTIFPHTLFPLKFHTSKKMSFPPSPASHCSVWITKTARLLVRLRNNYATTQLPRFFPPRLARHGCCEAVAARTVSATCIPTTRRVNARFETGEAVTCGRQMGVHTACGNCEGGYLKDRMKKQQRKIEKKSLSRFPGWEIEGFQYSNSNSNSSNIARLFVAMFLNVWIWTFTL